MGERMPEQTSPATHPLPSDPAIHAVLPDGTILYKSYQKAEQASRQLKASKHADDAAKKQAQVKIGETYAAKDGQILPYTLGGLAEFQLTGLIVVIVVLFCLNLMCSAIGRLFKMGKSSAAAQPNQSPLPVFSSAESGIHPGISDQQLVVILAASAQEMLGEPVRIKKFRPLSSRDQSWLAKGRSDLHSHQLK
jgi:ribosomal protein S17